MTRSNDIRQEIEKVMNDGKPHSVKEIKANLEAKGITGYSEGMFAGVVDNMQRKGLIVNVERGVYVKSNICESTTKKTCFVVSPIGEQGSEIRKNADQLFTYVIEPVCAECGFKTLRIDYEDKAESITRGIMDRLNESDLVIADLTGQNPNVFFEIGYRTALKKPIIHLKKKKESISFDIAAIRAFDYDLTDLDAVEEIKKRLKITIGNLQFEREELRDNSKLEGMSISLADTLNEVLYRLDDLYTLVEANEQRNIKTIIETMSDKKSQEESMETQIMKMLLPELLRNPKAADTLIELGEKFSNN